MKNSASWNEHALEDLLIDVQPGFARRPSSEDGNPAHLRTNNITPEGRLNFSQLKYVRATKGEFEKYALVKGDVLFNNTNSNIWVGKTAFVDRDLDALYSNHLTRLRVDSSKIDPEFLAIYLHKLQTDGFFKSIATRWVNQAAVNTNALRTLIVRIPSLDLQKQIVAVLRRADNLRQIREQTNLVTSKIVQSVFLKMFGSLRDSKNWQVRDLEQVCEQIIDIEHKMPKGVESGIPFISAKDLAGDDIDFEHCKYISKEDHERLSKRCKPRKGDILYSRIGVKLGIARLVKADREFNISYSLCMMRPNTELIDPNYLTYLLNSRFGKVQAKLGTQSIAVPDLGIKAIKTFKVMLPPLEVQGRFSGIVERFEKVRDEQQESAQEINELFQSLMHKAFSGELPRVLAET